jgi:hypothetical protein
MTDISKRIVSNTIGALAAGIMIGAAVTFYDKPAAALGPMLLLFALLSIYFRRPRHPNWPGPLHRVRRRCRHRLAPRRAALRPRVRPVAELGLQVPVSEGRLHQVGAFHARGTAAFDLHDVGAVAAGLGTQHPCRRGAALLDHLPDDGREILMAPP